MYAVLMQPLSGEKIEIKHLAQEQNSMTKNETKSAYIGSQDQPIVYRQLIISHYQNVAPLFVSQELVYSYVLFGKGT